MGVPAGSHATPSQRRDWGKARGKGSGAKDLPDSRTSIPHLRFMVGHPIMTYGALEVQHTYIHTHMMDDDDECHI